MRRWPIILLVALVAAWAVYWYASREIVTGAVAKAVAAMAGRGQTVSCSTQALGGFPLNIDFDCADAHFGDGGSETTAGLGHVTASAPLYWPGSVSASLTGPFVLASPAAGVSLEASWSKALATADAGVGGLKGFTASVAGLALERTGDSRKLPFLRLSADSADITAEPAGDGAYRFSVAASGVAIVASAKRTYPAFAADLAITANDFGSLGTNPGRAFADWLRKGGTFTVDHLSLSAMKASAVATGTLTLSADGLLSGDLKVRVVGLDDIPEVAGEIRPGLKKKTAEIVGAVGMFAKPAKDGSEPTLELPLTIRDGTVSLGIFPIGDVPRLKF